jgi:pimeloyl-ACP methyl ester carboxylesterase
MGLPSDCAHLAAGRSRSTCAAMARPPTADWSWDLALSDIAAVVDALGLIRPAVVGHSLGGMIAALWAAAHPDCPLAANLDGHGNPTRGTRPMLNYLGNNTHQQCSTTTEAAGSSANDHLSAGRTTGL